MEWQQTSHPAYQQILAMGPPALPLILEELRDHGGNWFYALGLIARVLGWDDPSEQAETRREAVRAWLAFGRERGLIQSDG